MKWFKNNMEILIGYVLGMMFIAISIFVVVNGKEILNFKEIAISRLHMSEFFDFINIYAYSFIKILSHYIHSFPAIYGLVLFLYGCGFIYISRLLKRTTQYDGQIALFYLMSSIFLFLFTAVLMFEVYDIFSLLYFAAFIILVFYVINRRRLNQEYRKMHYVVLLFIFSIAYFMTQNRIYDHLADNTVSPLDVMALNFFFILLSGTGLLALGNYIFLYRAKKVTPRDQEMSRVRRKKRDRDVSSVINAQTNEAFETLSRQSLKIDERIMLNYRRLMNRLSNLLNLQEDDIPRWMRKPGWLKFLHIELLFGALMLILTFIEMNNRNDLFNVSKFNVVKMQYFYEWTNLAAMLLIILCYLFFTLQIEWKKRGYIGQLITVTLLFVKIFTSFYLMIFKGINLSLFIPPVILLLMLMITPLFFYHLKKKY